jgi:hypothetical protein
MQTASFSSKKSDYTNWLRISLNLQVFLDLNLNIVDSIAEGNNESG